MLTLFACPKPFRGHIGVIQRNAIRSWTLLGPDVEVILFGEEEGSEEAAQELGVGHQPTVERNEFGTPFLNSLFDRAQELARHPYVCYVNCDIVLLSDFCEAVRRVGIWRKQFFLVGRRWDIDLTTPWDFSTQDWERRLRGRISSRGSHRPGNWIDYFVFPRGAFFRRIPRLLIGRGGWDNWLIWEARRIGLRVVDASSCVTAVHQNHDYAHLPGGEQVLWRGVEFQWNARLIGKLWHCGAIDDASHRLSPDGVRRNWHAIVYRMRRNADIARGYTLAAARRARSLLAGSSNRPQRSPRGNP